MNPDPAFFNGLGTVVWENVFGWWNPWSADDRAIMRKIISLLRNHRAAFQSEAWQPLVPTLDEYVMANEWSAGDETIWTVINLRFETTSAEIIAVPSRAGARYFDAWHGYREITVRTEGDTTYIPLTIERRSAGCAVRSLAGKNSSYQIGIDTGSDEQMVTTLEDNLPSVSERTIPWTGGREPLWGLGHGGQRVGVDRKRTKRRALALCHAQGWFIR